MSRLVQLNRHGEELGGYRDFQAMCGAETDPNLRKRLLKILRQVTEKELTPRQQQMIRMHYFDNLTMTAIAEKLGVNKSTVSRSIKGAKKKIGLCMKYLF